MDRVFTRWEYSGHLPSIELHGIFKDCVPILINLLINLYFSRWFGIETLCQNLSAVRTNWILLLVFADLLQDFVWELLECRDRNFGCILVFKIFV